MITSTQFIKTRGTICFLIFLSFIIITEPIIAQPRGVVVVTGRIEKDNRPIPNGTIRVYHQDNLVQELRTNIIGRFEFYLQFDEEYTVDYSADGMVAKRIDYNTSLPERLSRRGFYEFDFIIELFPEIEQVDLSFFEQSLATIKFDGEETFEFYYPEEEFSENLAIANNLRDQVNDFIRRTDRYEFLINRADRRFTNQEYESALTDYNEASGLFPTEDYPWQRINEINEILALREDAHQRYNRLIAQADEYFSIEVYDSALELYQEASQLRPEAQHPKQRIEYIQRLMTQQLADSDRQRRRDSIFQAELLANAKYDSLIIIGDRYFEESEYMQARTTFLEAAEVKPNEQYPRDMLATISRIMRGEREVEASYAQTIQRADSLFNRQRYRLAILEYNTAHELRPADPYPPQQIEIIERLIAENIRINEAYQELITQADNQFQSRNYAESRDLYENALEIKPNEDYPRLRIEEIATILGRRERDLQAYNEAIRQADRYYNQQNYAQALEAYREALRLRGSDSYSENKISEIEQLLTSARSESLTYQQQIEQGDGLFTRRQFVQARDAYYRALSIVPGSEYPTNRINEINELIARGEEMEAFYERGSMIVSGVSEVISNGNENRFQIVPFSRRRSGSYIETTVKNSTGRNIRLFVNYGVGAARHGGIAVTVPPVDDIYELRVNVSSQSSWIRFDNNWISFSPVGGDLEVESVSIVFGDR